MSVPGGAQPEPSCDLAQLGARFRDGGPVKSSWQEKGQHTAWLGKKVDGQQRWTRVVTRESETRWAIRYLAFADKRADDPCGPASGALVRGEKRWTWTADPKPPAHRALQRAAEREARWRSRQAGLVDWLVGLLPKAPVRAGETWTLELADMARLLEVPYPEAPAVKTSSARGKLVELSESHATIEVEVKLDYPGDAKTDPAEAGLKLRASLPRQGVRGSVEITAWIQTPDESVRDRRSLERAEVEAEPKRQ